jgi:hypothetical protein
MSRSSSARDLVLVFALTVLMTASPVVTLLEPNARGCARGVALDGKPLAAGPTPFCIREAISLHLDDALIVLRVEAPHRFESLVRSRVFVYRVVEGRLVPRFLGSGFSSREVLRIYALEGALGLDTITPAGAHEQLRCVFDGFPLVCSEVT